MKQLRIVCAVIAFAALAAGCSGGSADNAGNGSAASSTPMSLHGVVHGGQSPIVGATVTLYAVSPQASSQAAVLATATTDSNGNFLYSFTCPYSAAQVYVTSSGGNPGNGVNSAVHLMAVLGPCGNLHQSVTINELTTVAAAYTANRFIGPSGCSDCSGAAPDAVDNISGNAIGVANAMGNAALLVNPISGLAAPSLPTAADCPSTNAPANCMTVRRLNTVGDALAACVNSSGPTSSQCVQLFNCTTPGATYINTISCTAPGGATLPTDTLQAVLNVARNPAQVSTNGLYETCARDVVFSPVIINGVPPEFTLSLNITGGGMALPYRLAIDAFGNVWVTNFVGSSVTELSPNGSALSDVGFAGTAFPVGFNPAEIGIDANGNVWVANSGNSQNVSSVSVLDPAGSPTLGSPLSTGGLSAPFGLAIAPSGNVWVANYSGDSVSEFNAAGAANTAAGFPVAVGTNPWSVAVDAAGYVWVANKTDNTVSQLNAAGGVLNTTAAGYGGIAQPYQIAVDPSGNVWLANLSGTNLTELTVANEVVISGTSISGGGLNGPAAVAFDAAGNAWAANSTSSTVSELTAGGAALSPSTGFAGAGLSTPRGIAIDPSGNVWVPNYNNNNNSVTLFFGAAAPTRAPLVEAIAQGFAP